MARGRRKKRKTQKDEGEDEDEAKIPRSFVLKKGKVGPTVYELVEDLRRMMEPHTAHKLKVSKSNTLKDFISVAGPLGVSHFMMLTQTERGTQLRIAKIPHGPTLTFRCHNYALAGDIFRLQRRPRGTDGPEYQTAPLVVLNNFGGEDKHIKLMATMFQNMFPTINVQKVNVNECQRVVMFNYNTETKRVEMRHYYVGVGVAGVSKTVRKLIKRATTTKKKVPNLAKFEDMAEYVTAGDGAITSDSEGEEMPESRVTLEREDRKHRTTQQQCAVRLKEVGPRLELQLLKVEGDAFKGEVLYHEYIKKTPEQLAALKAHRQAKETEKARRRAEQEKNVERKRKREDGEDGKDNDADSDADSGGDDGVEEPTTNVAVNSDEDDDAEWYRREVGEEPDDEFMIRKGHNSRGRGRGRGERYNPLYKQKRKPDGDRKDQKPGKGGKDSSKPHQRRMDLNVGGSTYRSPRPESSKQPPKKKRKPGDDQQKAGGKKDGRGDGFKKPRLGTRVSGGSREQGPGSRGGRGGRGGSRGGRGGSRGGRGGKK